MTVDNPERFVKCAACGRPITTGEKAELIEIEPRPTAVLAHTACLEGPERDPSACGATRGP